MKPIFKVILLAIAYLATFILGSLTGLIHPACYAYVGALLPFITAFIYKAMVKQVPGFGAASIMNGLVLILFLIAGEADTVLSISSPFPLQFWQSDRPLTKNDTIGA